MDNMTAKVSCFARAYHHKNNEVHIFDDYIAEMILGKDYGMISENMTNGLKFFFPDFEGTKEEGLRLIVDKQLAPSVLGRSAYCESKLAKEQEHGCRQYVIFASGYDTFSLRNTAESLKIFELDFPEILEDKLKRIEKANLNSTAVYVPCNLANVSWKEKLLKAGYNKQCKTFGSLLGISYYLNKEDFKSLLKNISEVMSEGATICFDYPSINESRETKTNQMLASSAGENMKALYTQKEIEQLLKQSGFELIEHLDSKEMTKRYCEEYNNANNEHQIQAPAGVEYVYAKKINIT